jgi:hypothetical protein
MNKLKVLPAYNIKDSDSMNLLVKASMDHFKKLAFEPEAVVPYAMLIDANKKSYEFWLTTKEQSEDSEPYIEKLKKKAKLLLARSTIIACAVVYDAFVLDEDGIDKEALVICTIDKFGKELQHNYPYVLGDREIVYGERWTYADVGETSE